MEALSLPPWGMTGPGRGCERQALLGFDEALLKIVTDYQSKCGGRLGGGGCKVREGSV